MMRKIFLIRAAITPIELLLRRNPCLAGRQAFIVLLIDQPASAPLRNFAPLRETKNLKPLKLLYG